MTTPAKKQRAISSFFTPAARKARNSAPPLEIDADSKRKLLQFLHISSKKPRLEQAENEKDAEIVDSNVETEQIDLDSPENGAESPEIGPSKSPAKNKQSDVKSSSKPRKRTAGAVPKASSGGSKSAKTSKLTPLEKQFIDLKTQNPDKILPIQVGYKFKFFGEDAVVVSQLLNIMLLPGNLKLTERNYDRFAYCSIPDNRLHIHLQRLLNHGLKVGVVKQTETAAIKSVESKSGLFDRKITGVYTKATYMGDELLTGDPAVNRNNNADDSPDGTSCILCIDELGKETSVVAVLPLTGDIVHDTFSDNIARDELDTRLAYLFPSEVVVIGKSQISPETNKILKLKNPTVSIVFQKQKPASEILADLDEFFATIDGDGRSAHLSEYYHLNYLSSIQGCIIELAKYLSEFKLSNVFTIPSNFNSLTDARKYMLLPANTLRALDIFQVEEDPSARKGTLVWLLDHAHTKNGSRMLQKWISRPLVNKDEIEHRLLAVQVLRTGLFVHMLDAFKGAVVKIGKTGVDLDRLLIKIHYSATYSSDRISRKELYTMLRSFSDILEVFRRFGHSALEEYRNAHDAPLLERILQSMHDLSKEQIVDDFLRMINASGALSDSNLNDQKIQFFNLGNEKVERISVEHEQIAIVESQLDQELESIRRFLKRPQLSFVTNLKETHLIEVRNGKQVEALPSDWLKISGTKTVSRFRTPEVSKLHKQLQYHNEMLLKACDECYNNFLKEIDSCYEHFHQIVSNISTFDCLLSLASAGSGSVAFNRPQISDKQIIKVKLSSHPILHSLPQNQSSYVPNDVNISYDEDRVLIITGPNMGGKSSYVKQIALLVIMAQIGSYIPCTEATIGIFDSIFIRMGASDNILRGKSTFMVEMMESAHIIQNYTLKSLIILDEIGRGTGTSDGIALAYSILKYIIEDSKRPLTLFITHYPSLHVLELEHKEVKNYHMAFIEKTEAEGSENDWPEVIFLYKLVRGVVSNLYGLNVAKLAGVDTKIIENAYQVSESMKNLIEAHKLLSGLAKLNRTNVVETLQEICANL